MYSHSQHKESVPYLIFIGLIILQSLAVGVIILKQHGMGEEILLTHAREMMQRLADGAIYNTSHHLQSAENAAQISKGLIRDNILKPDDTEAFEMYLLEMLKNHKEFSGFTYGDQEGKLLYVARLSQESHQYLTKRIFFNNGIKQEYLIRRNADFIPQARATVHDDFDPRQRPWYQAFEQQKLLWTIPYIFFTSNAPGITVSTPIADKDDKPIGAFGADIEISSLSDFLAKRNISPHSSAFIVGRGGALAAHSDIHSITRTGPQGHLQLLNIAELTNNPVLVHLWSLIEELDDTSLLKGQTLDFTLNGAKYLAVVRSFSENSQWPWIMSVVAPEDDFIGIFRHARHQQLLRALLYSIGITLLLFLLAAKFLKPVRRLLHHAHFDPLTNLYNRRAFFEHCAKKEAKAATSHTPLCLAMIDVDNFKKVNDTYGHGVGDELLIAIAGRLRGTLSKNDLIGRFGGEEFIVLMTDAKIDRGVQVCNRLRKVIANAPFRTEVGQVSVSISIGVASLDNCPDIQEGITRADQALLRAKSTGKNQVVRAV